MINAANRIRRFEAENVARRKVVTILLTSDPGPLLNTVEFNLYIFQEVKELVLL